MKTKRTTFGRFVGLFGFFVATTTFGAITWSNLSATLPDGGNFGRGTNWIGDDGLGGHVPTTGALCVFDGFTPGNLSVYSLDGINGAGSGNPIGNSFGPNGITLHLTSNQIGSLLFFTPALASVGMGFNEIYVDNGAGQLTLGDNTANQLIATLRPSSGRHKWVNNSTNPVVINPDFQIQFGGGTSHTINFQGTGDFCVTNNLRNNNFAPAGSVQWDSTGTMVWAAGGSKNKFNDAGLAGVYFNAGNIIIKSNGLLPIVSGGVLTNNAVLLKLDAAAAAQGTFNFPIHGSGPIQVNSGTWTFTSGASTFTGNISLTGGELIANGSETPGVSGALGVNGVISFFGGTLGFSTNNAFDYSSRFDTAAGQAYSFDTGGRDVMFTNSTGLTSSGGTLAKLGLGTLTLAAPSTYSGATTISAGKLVFKGSKTGFGDITVSNGATLGVTENGAQVSPGTLTLGAATLEFNNVTNTATAPLAAGTLLSAGALTFNINHSALAIGQSYPLLSWTNGPPPAVALGKVVGADGVLFTNGNAIQFNVTSIVQPPTLNVTNSGNSLKISWANGSNNFRLQMQTNLLGVDWMDYPGGNTSPVTVPIDSTNSTMFFRLVLTP